MTRLPACCHAQGDVVFRQGDPGNVMYFIAGGKLEVRQGAGAQGQAQGQAPGPACGEERYEGLGNTLAVEASAFSQVSTSDGSFIKSSK
jgi:hypothetical protein